MSIKNIIYYIKRDGGSQCCIMPNNFLSNYYIAIFETDLHNLVLSMSWGSQLRLSITPRAAIKLLRVYGKTFEEFY